MSAALSAAPIWCATTLTVEATATANALARHREAAAFGAYAVQPIPAPAAGGTARTLRVACHPAVAWTPPSVEDACLRQLDPAAPGVSGAVRELLVEVAMEPALRAAGRHLALEIVAEAAPRSLPFAAGLLVHWHGGSGAIRIDLSSGAAAALTAALARWPGARRPVPVPLALHLRLAAMTLTLPELRGLLPGDVLLPDHGDGVRMAVAMAGGLVWQARLDGDRVVVETGRRRASGAGLEGWTLEEHGMGDANGWDAGGAAEEGPDAPLDEVPIRLGFELGRMEVTVAEIEEIGPGHVFTLPRAASPVVDIVANGRRIGQGEIVQVGAALGVRVLRLAGR